MEQEKVISNELDVLNFYSLEYILEHFDEFSFHKISINPVLNVDTGKRIVQHRYTDANHPIGVGDIPLFAPNALYIDHDYYIKNKANIDILLAKIIYKMKDSITLDGTELITNNIANAATCNEKVSTLSLVDYGGDDFTLTEELYKNIKNHPNITKVITKKVVTELEDNFDPVIGYNSKRTLFQFYDYESLTGATSIDITFRDEIRTDEEFFDSIKYLKLLNSNCEINIDVKNNDFLNRFIDELNNNNITNKTKIKVNDKVFFNNVIVEKIKDKDVTIDIDLEEYDIKDYIAYEKRLNELVTPALGLSPFERYLYVYDVVKKYKPYKENEDDKSLSRNIYSILDNDFMVCVGYSKMLVDLLARLGINATEFGLVVNIGFDDVAKDDMDVGDKSVNTVSGGHSRVRVRIYDPKYGLDGIYYVDATWDNYMDKDIYAHALMTAKEYNELKRENVHSDYALDELFEANDINDFYDRINYYLPRKREKKITSDLESFMKYTYPRALSKLENSKFKEQDIIDSINRVLKENYHINDSNFYVGVYNRDIFTKRAIDQIISGYYFKDINNPSELDKITVSSLDYLFKELKKDNLYAEIDIMNKLVNYVKELEPALYEELKNKYPVILQTSSTLPKEQVLDTFDHIVEEVGNFIVKVNNNKVNGQTIIDAVKVVYKANGLSDEEINTKIEETIKDNKEVYAKAHPERKRIYFDGREDIYANGDNKFDEDSIKTR